jgi:L-lactate dehydrogenase complex protein LldG
MSAARERVLTRLRAAQRTARLSSTEARPRALEPAPAAPEQCVDRLRQELTLLGVENHLEPSPAELCARVASLIAGRRVLSWDPEQLPYDVGPLLGSVAYGRSPREEQAAAELGVTGCDAAIAETGTLALFSGKGRSRAVSLLPPVHLALVRRADVCFSMGEFFRMHAERLAREASCTFITGPSRTADIELTLTLGVHGPGRVIVLIGP